MVKVNNQKFLKEPVEAASRKHTERFHISQRWLKAASTFANVGF